MGGKKLKPIKPSGEEIARRIEEFHRAVDMIPPSWRGNPRGRIETFRELYESTANPLYAWGAYLTARAEGIDLPDWALAGC